MDNINKEDDPHWLQVLEKKQQMRKKRKRQVFFQKLLILSFVLAAVSTVFFFVMENGKKASQPGSNTQQLADTQKQPSSADSEKTDQTFADQDQTKADGADLEETDTEEPDGQKEDSDYADDSTQAFQYIEKTRTLGGGIASNHAVLVDAVGGTVLACKNEKDRIVPASMTKVLTLLTAVDKLGDTIDLDDKFKITVEITDYCYLNECSVAGFDRDEKVTVRDLLYGTILPSGADASLGLAEYTAGSQEAFVELMNAKLEDLGLSDTAHFTNCTGIYDEDHYCTLFDLAVIMKAAVQNDLCREVLSARTYTTSKTKQHPDGILISNWFLRRIEDKDTGGEVACAKTGYVQEAGNCAVSYGIDKKDREYICVTADAPGTWKCIYDHVKLYKRFSGRK